MFPQFAPISRSALGPILLCLFLLPALSQAPPPGTEDTLDRVVPLQVIVVSSPEEAQRILDLLKQGEDFAALARENSTDPSASSGGYIGKLAPYQLRPELRDVLQLVRPGQVSKVAHTPEGYAILKVMTDDLPPAGENTDPAARLALAATASVKLDLNVSGMAAANSALAQFPKPLGWDLEPEEICEARKGSLSGAIDYLTRLLETPNQDSRGPLDILQLHYVLAELYVYQGNMDPAIERFQQAYRIAQSAVPDQIPQLEESLAIAYLHKSEMENDVYREPGIRCLFPMRSGLAYEKTASSQKAIEYFLKYLEKKPNELDVQWLLNLAYMTIGKYPAEVPRQYLIPASKFISTESMGRFTDVAPQAGLHSFSMAGGLIVDDFENNGRFDVVTSSVGNCDPVQYFHSNGDGTFTNKTAEAGLTNELGGLNMIQTDYNNDGCTDILLLRGGWEFPQRKSLLRNNCNGTFTDVTFASGLGQNTSATQTAVWADINNDGLLDLFVGNENAPSQLFLNRGDGTFEDIAKSAGVDRITFTKGVVAADYDNDGYVDFYVSNLGTNFLYHNNHDNTFTEVAKQAGVSITGQSFAAWFFDYDNDGLPDLFVTSYYSSVDETMRTYLGFPHNAPTLKLFKNIGNGKFKDVTTEVRLDKVFLPMGGNFGDIDNDGFLDIYLGTGDPSYASLVPNVLLRNHDAKYFVDVTSSSGTGELHKGHGVAFADMDNTGHEDILEVVGGAVPGDRHAFRFFKNPGNSNDWIRVKLVGVKTNRPAIGARIEVTVREEGGARRSIYRWVGSGGSFGASPFEQHIGLGKAAKIERLQVVWPSSNTRQVFTNIAKNQTIQIKEFEDTYTKLARPRYQSASTGTSVAGSNSRNGLASGKIRGEPGGNTP